MGRKRGSGTYLSKDNEECQNIEASYSPYNESKKKLFFEDPLMDNIQMENITISDVRRITNKTFDFLRSTGLRQTHISATSGINQSILSIILRDPGTKTISLNRKRDIILKLCEYYRKVNEGVISHDPQTAPKICTRKKSAEVIQKRRTEDTILKESLIKDKTVEANLETDHDLQLAESKNLGYGNEEMGTQNKRLINYTNSNEHFSTSQRDKPSMEPLDSNENCKGCYIFDLCVNCFNKGVKFEKKLLEFKGTNSGPILSFINGTHNLEYLDLESTSYIENTIPTFEDKSSFLKLVMTYPILIPLTFNIRHYTVNEVNDSTGDNRNSSHINKSNPVAFLSSIKGKGYKADNFIWCSTSDTELLWGYIENLCRERHLSLFVSDKNKRKAFLWLKKEIQNYKNLYLEFLYVISKSGIHPASNPDLICEIHLNETHDDVVIIDKFKWNISQSPFLLKKHIGCIVSDIKLPHELYSVLLHSALKQLFDSIINFMENIDDENINFSLDFNAGELQNPNSYKTDDTSSIYSSGANSTVNERDLHSDDNMEVVSTGKIIKWGDEADLEYDSDDNAIIYPIIESAAVKKQIENKNRFTKRKL
ncbi:SNF5 like protein [Cryptosporidium ryanae]|uniref:SNF5 like protein n=1 Tax=Cryptosporidium ryanae TaxID=515981 RepID=UPI003519EC77|nr:SNF5 like protein [Cryptosporidium ryanae]